MEQWKGKSALEIAKAHLGSGAKVCPFCGEDYDLQHGVPEMELQEAWQQITCNACGAKWTEGYVLNCVSFEQPINTEFIYPKKE